MTTAHHFILLHVAIKYQKIKYDIKLICKFYSYEQGGYKKVSKLTFVTSFREFDADIVCTRDFLHSVTSRTQNHAVIFARYDAINAHLAFLVTHDNL